MADGGCSQFEVVIESCARSTIRCAVANRRHRYLPGAWPDPKVPIEETAETMHMLLREGKGIRASACRSLSFGCRKWIDSVTVARCMWCSHLQHVRARNRSRYIAVLPRSRHHDTGLPAPYVADCYPDGCGPIRRLDGDDFASWTTRSFGRRVFGQYLDASRAARAAARIVTASASSISLSLGAGSRHRRALWGAFAGLISCARCDEIGGWRVDAAGRANDRAHPARRDQ